MSANKMPVLFIGHGSPMNILLKNPFTRALARLGRTLPRPKAILVVSAHWLTDGTSVGTMDAPRIIYDFYGFPQRLYRVTYPCPGAPDYARLVQEAVRSVDVTGDSAWGLDHASWAVLKHIYPRADIPVFEMSVDYCPYNDWRPKPLLHHYTLAKELSPLREKGVLIIGSGNIVHNLGMIRGEINAHPDDWAVEFDEKIKSALLNGDHKTIVNYTGIGEAAVLSVPTLDHYLPMIYAAALQEKGEPLEFIYEGFHYSTVSMRCFRIGGA